MNGATASVIIPSRGRPDSLVLCLKAVSQLFHTPFEVVVVADQAGRAAIEHAGLAEQIKLVDFDEPNVAKARNMGLAQSSGDIIAFLDDDSVPEPAWLAHLVRALTTTEAVAATGYVRGRNGISFQLKAQTVSDWGRAESLEISGDAPVVLAGAPGRAISTIGTNCAFRRSAFLKHGMFDPLYRYFLDESDFNMRLAHAGARTAIVPGAQVHHRVGASERRRHDRVPTTLWDIGHSTAVFSRKYAGPGGSRAVLDDAASAQRKRLQRLGVGAREIARLLETMKDGANEGLAVYMAPPPELAPETRPFKPFRTKSNLPQHRVVAGMCHSGARLRRKAKDLVRGGAVVSVFIFSPTARNHVVRFHPDGYWEQKGGLLGRSDRNESRLRPLTVAKRVEKEHGRIALSRYPWKCDV